MFERYVTSAILVRGRRPACLLISLYRLSKQAARAYLLSILSLSISLQCSPQFSRGSSVRACRCEAFLGQAHLSMQISCPFGWTAFLAVNFLAHFFFRPTKYLQKSRSMLHLSSASYHFRHCWQRSFGQSDPACCVRWLFREWPVNLSQARGLLSRS